MSTAKSNRHRPGVSKLEPIDWREFANDAVLNGNMSTLYQRPVSEDPSAYASPEALLEIEKRGARPLPLSSVPEQEAESPMGPTVGAKGTVGPEPTVGPTARDSMPGMPFPPSKPTVGIMPTVGILPTVGLPPTVGLEPTVGMKPTVGILPTVGLPPTVGLEPTVGKPMASSTSVESELKSDATVGLPPTVGLRPTVGMAKFKPIRDVQDALTLAGQVLYKAMYGVPDGAKSKSCTKGYRQLAAETHLDKDTVRDLIGDFKDKGIVRQIETYDPDTRSAKTYEVLSYKAILQMWRDAGLLFVTAGRQRPTFCTGQGEPVFFRPTVGPELIGHGSVPSVPTVGPTMGEPAAFPMRPTAVDDPTETSLVIDALQQITGNPVDQEAADRLISNCRTAAPDCTTEEILEFAWNKAFLCRSGKIGNPVGFLITQVPKHFQGAALQAYRDGKRKELEAAAELAARAEARHREIEEELAGTEVQEQTRREIAERHRTVQGIDLKGVLEDPDADDVLKHWAKRMLQLGRRTPSSYS